MVNTTFTEEASMKDIISINDFSREEIETIFRHTKALKKNPKPDLLKGKVMASCFFEPSTRTRLSFESAMCKLGGSYTGFADSKISSSAKGESLQDAIRVISAYCDVIVLRHPKEGSAALAAEISNKPVINAGDGANQHPTQTLLDLYTISEHFPKLDGLHIALHGDLKYGRTVHSLAMVAHLFNLRLYFVSAAGLEMPEIILSELKHKGVKFSFHKTIEEVMPKIDVLYMTRIQKERFKTDLEYKRESHSYCLTKEKLAHAKESMKILHPLPRVDEILTEVDETEHACYFEQAENGLYVRQAILATVLGELK